MTVRIKRVYEDFAASDGYRVLVDRLWPRGVSKERAHVDVWLKEVGPSDELRKWFHHEAQNWNEFHRRYQDELSGSSAVKELREIVAAHKTVTLVYSARDEERNQAVVLAELVG